jgi:hypothetical protein
MNPEELLRSGCQLLDAVLVPHGFRFRVGSTGKGSGGHFAAGKFLRGDRALTLHFRWSLGLVSYSHGTVSASHEALVRALGVWKEAAYPGFSDDPLDGFRHLAADLRRYLGVFLSGTDKELLDLLTSANALESKRPKGIAGLP